MALRSFSPSALAAARLTLYSRAAGAGCTLCDEAKYVLDRAIKRAVHHQQQKAFPNEKISQPDIELRLIDIARARNSIRAEAEALAKARGPNEIVEDEASLSTQYKFTIPVLRANGRELQRVRFNEDTLVEQLDAILSDKEIPGVQP